jgi:hypothetical protein
MGFTLNKMTKCSVCVSGSESVITPITEAKLGHHYLGVQIDTGLGDRCCRVEVNRAAELTKLPSHSESIVPRTAYRP